MSYVFYSKSGNPFAYTEDNCHIFHFKGEPLAYIYEGSVYSYKGNHLGFYLDGWIRDNDGLCIFFTKGAKDGPPKIRKDISRVKSPKLKIPIKNAREKIQRNLEIKQDWSELSSLQFFDHNKE